AGTASRAVFLPRRTANGGLTKTMGLSMTHEAAGPSWVGRPPTTRADLDWAQRSFRAHYAPYLPRDRDAAILDFGCGFGTFLTFLARQGYRNYLGMDVDQKSVDYCREHVSSSVVYVPDGRDFLAERPAAYDAIVMREVICYFTPPDLHAYLTVAREALRPK